jgi:hypothetical protein
VFDVVQGEFLNSAQLTGKLAGSGKIENLIHEKYDISSAKLSQVSSMLILFNSGGLLTRIGPPGCSCRCLQIPPHNQFPLSLPESWPRKRDYINQDFRLKAKIFKTERKKSIAYLRSLDNPKWDNYYEHPTLGKLDGNHFLRNWVAHDYLHIRQITKRKYEYLQHMTSEDVSYAGVW